ncbi:hypothetical protein CJ030_MR8G020194 [Morella rubra]|uniref:Uncharacterized protein n=1 Tax=Morella rubra TaxID=262757 RepID=A0A6A1URH7_9ROSI|nr:hypothetical protein CJ030_MR8G020194 [Morella rubra]
MGKKMAGDELGPRFTPKKGGVIPPKRKSVKRMMFESIIKSIASLLFPRHHASFSEVEGIPRPNKSTEINIMKNMKIFPQEGHPISAPPDGHLNRKR